MFILKEDDCILVSISQGCDDSDHFRLEDMNAVHVTSDMVAVYGRWCMQWRVVALEVGPESCSLPCPRYLCLLHSHVCAFMIPWHRIAVTGCASCIPVSEVCC